MFGGKSIFSLPKVLVTSIYGHEDMLDYLSDYRTQDKFKGKHYYPSGALCWFECNRFGDPTGSVYYVRKVPDMKLLENIWRKCNYKRLLQRQNRKYKLNELFARESVDTERRPTLKLRFDR